VRRGRFVRYILEHFKDFAKTAGILVAATFIGMIFLKLGFTESNIITVYILGVLLTSLFTRGYTCSVLASVFSVMLFNFFFTVPRLTFQAYHSGYPVTFAIMLMASVITGTLAAKLKDHAKLSAQTAFQTKIMLDTNQLLQKAQDDWEIINITASQLSTMFERCVAAYAEEGGQLSERQVFVPGSASQKSQLPMSKERDIADWVFQNRKRAGAMTSRFNNADGMYLAIRINEKVYGVVGIQIGERPLDTNEYSFLLSMLGECAMAIENNRNARAKERAAVLAQNEQLRANILRAISHDLRTPLTSISGNASNLLSNYEVLDEESRTQIFNDIYEDSQWLIRLVENLLSVTRLEEGRMNFNMSVQLVDEVLEEAMQHLNRRSVEHKILVEYPEELILARMDARLVVQVLINLVDNAIKYTPAGSEIKVTVKKTEGYVAFHVADDGPGISEDDKPRVFEMFFTGENRIADGCRSLGLGLPLCKSIINAHGGELILTDNEPSGAIFTFTLPVGEVNINE